MNKPRRAGHERRIIITSVCGRGGAVVAEAKVRRKYLRYLGLDTREHLQYKNPER